MEVLTKVLRALAWIGAIIWMSALVVAMAYRGDPIVRGAVRSIAVSVAGIFTDTRELQKEFMDETKKELKK